LLGLYSYKVMVWRTSNTLSSDLCVEALQEALTRLGSSEIFNTDQGSQFITEVFTTLSSDQCYPIDLLPEADGGNSR